MVPRLFFGIIFFLCGTANSFAFSLFGESKPVIPDEGLRAEGNHQWQKAISIYLDGLISSPNRVDLWLRIASIEHQLKNYPLAIDAYNHAIRLQPNDSQLYKTLSEIYAELNRPNEALDAINNAVKLKPNDIHYLVARAKIANWNKNLYIALESNQRILALSRDTQTKLDSLELLSQIGSLQNQLHHYQEAIKTYTHAIQINPNNAAQYRDLSQVYAAAKEPENAMWAIDKALHLEPNNIQYLSSKAIFASWLKKDKLAVETYQAILKISPNNKIALKAVSLIEHQMLQNITEAKPLSPFEQFIKEANDAATLNRYDLAAIAIKKAIALKPADPALYQKLSEIYATAKQPQLALVAINKAVNLAPTQIQYWRARAKLAAWAGDKVQALDSYEQILKIKHLDQDAMLNLAHILAWQSKTDEAIQAYRQLLSIYPKMAEGWVKYAEVLSWTGNFLDSLDALKHYKQLRGETTQYRETMARVLALIGRFKSALAINEPLLAITPNDLYLLSTEVTALTTARKVKKAVNYLKKANSIRPNDPLVIGLNHVTLTPIRSNINLEGDYTAASDTTKIVDLPVSAQYFLTPATSLLFQGLYEQATAAASSGLGPVNGNGPIADESAMVGFTTQINSINLKGLFGGLNIQRGNNHAIYDASLNTSLGEKAQISVGSLHNLYRPYLVPQTPKLISLQIMETRISGFLQWQPFVQKHLNVLLSYSNLSDHNNYVHLNIWPKARVYASQHWLVSLGIAGDFWQYRRRATNGYYSPLHFDGYEGTIEFYYAQSENIGYSVSSGFGMQKDETFPHYYYEEDLAMQMFLGIFTDWELQVKGGFTLRDNPINNYHCWSAGLVLTRRF